MQPLPSVQLHVNVRLPPLLHVSWSGVGRGRPCGSQRLQFRRGLQRRPSAVLHVALRSTVPLVPLKELHTARHGAVELLFSGHFHTIVALGHLHTGKHALHGLGGRGWRGLHHRTDAYLRGPPRFFPHGVTGLAASTRTGLQLHPTSDGLRGTSRMRLQTHLNGDGLPGRHLPTGTRRQLHRAGCRGPGAQRPGRTRRHFHLGEHRLPRRQSFL